LEAELREKIEALQNRKASDDNRMCIVDRYWTQLDEDLRLILERFDSQASTSQHAKSASPPCEEASGEVSNGNETANKENEQQLIKYSSSTTRNFISKLNDWDKVEIDDALKERVKFTTQIVAKLVTNYDK
jgi:E3 ubiquitin-protein ligase BRE1